MLRPATILMALVLLLGGFAYGYVAHRDQLFPYGIKTRLLGSFSQEDGADAHDPDSETIRQLISLGYLAGYEAPPPRSGVTIHDPELAYPGLNLLTSGHGTDVDLLDMRGNVVHRWSYDMTQLWEPGEGGETGYFRRAYMYDNGDLLAVHDSRTQRQREKDVLIKLDSNSNLLWAFADGCHHDLEVQPDGTIFLLTRDYHTYPDFRRGMEVLEDYVTQLDANGNRLKSVSILQALRDSPYAAMLQRAPWVDDLLHTNSVEVLDGRLAHKSDALRAGNVLVSIRHINAIVVIDMEAEKVVWAMTQLWHRQHQPTVLDNGNILLFDNNGNRGKSQVLEFDPITQDLAWSYQADSPEGFYAQVCGSNDRLPNGNTIITESTTGRVFEVTPEKQIVWEFFNEHRAGEEGEFIALVPELVRLPTSTVPSWASAP